MKKFIIIFLMSFCVMFYQCGNKNVKPQVLPQIEDKVNIIFDTDMGSDCDDAGALALLHQFADEGMVNLLGVIFSSGINRYGIGVCDAINTYYGRGDIPLGQYAGQDVGDPKNYYSEQIAMDKTRFPHDVIDASEDMIAVYKRILREQPDKSVTILFVGHPHALYFLIHDTEGENLIKTKVQKCVFVESTGVKPSKGWNFCHNGVAPYISDILTLCTVNMYFSSSGSATLTGHQLLPLMPENNPVREAYRLFGNSLREGRPSWDPIAVMFAVQPQLFVIDSIGSLVQNENDEVYWDVTGENPNHKKVTPINSDEMGNIIEKMMAEKPKRKN